MINSGSFKWTTKSREWMKSWVNLLLTRARPYQRPQWLGVLGVARPCLSQAQRNSKAVPGIGSEEWQGLPQVEVLLLTTCAESISLSLLLQDICSCLCSPQIPPMKIKSSTLAFFICMQWALSVPATPGTSSSENKTHLIPAFLSVIFSFPAT